ncbi:MAG: hypothetical protein CVV42_00730 [Candidatus Riflebacteria bacterium HGW-Riflebacteria-2]|nr:MAG: hypothetical protein CVV42_00730 [Candidatus Riflebacteria bacterium HGW-Riflebacteria-2]
MNLNIKRLGLKCIALLLVFSLVNCTLLEAARLIIPQGTLVKIRLQQTLSTRSTKEGQIVRFTVLDAVRIGRRKVIEKGASVEAYVSHVRHPQRFGRNASLKIKFLSVTSVKGRDIPVEIGQHAAKTNEQMGMAAGAAVGGALIFGPVGLLAGFFVKGKNIEIPSGTILHVEVAEDTIF